MKKFEELTFTDHYMFEKVLQDSEICKELLERLLKIRIERLEYPQIEKTISPYYETKGVRLDVYLRDSDRIFDIELQNATDFSLPLRTRYYQSMLDTDNLLKGQHYSQLPESFIIFICSYDPFGLGLPIYTFQNRCNEEESLFLNDRSTRKFFNALAYEKESDVEIKTFLQYTYNNRSADEFTNRIDSLVANIKRQELSRKEYAAVNLHDQDTFLRGKNEGILQGFADGERQKALATARNLYGMNLSAEQIAAATGLSLAEVQSLQQ